jgi:hypothetical protein
MRAETRCAVAAGLLTACVASPVQAQDVDAQLRQLLLSGPWCHFSYAGGNYGGTTKQERVVFRADGTLTQSGGAESSYSGQQNNQYGDSTGNWGAWGGNQQTTSARWKVGGGALGLTEDGVNWEFIGLQVSLNSEGWPIINADGKEYFRCD